MHVMVINVFFAPVTYGGATVVAEEVARRLVRRHGARVTAVSAMARQDLPPYAMTRAAVGEIETYMINMPRGRSAAQMWANPEVARRIAALAAELDPDVVHVHCVQEIGADVIAAMKAQGRPVILSLHDYWWLCERQFMIRPDGRWCGQDPVRPAGCRGCVDDPGQAAARAGMLAAYAGLADIVTAPSRFALGLYQRSGFAPGRLRLWENGVALPGPGFFEAQAARRAADARMVFGFVGGPSVIKGWPLVRAAFSGPGRSDFRGQLVEGSLDGGWWRGRDLSALRGDWQVVPRYGAGSMDAFFAGIDVLLFLSQWKETFGLTIREALARGVRVIQTDGGGTVEHAGRKVARVLPIGSGPDALARAVEAELRIGRQDVAPVEVRDFDAQAAELAAMAGELLAAGGQQICAA